MLRILVWLFVGGAQLIEVFDLVVAPALRDLGDRWEHGGVRVFEEHRAVMLVHRALHEIRRMLPDRSKKRPTAVVATLSGDPYTVGITMAELTLGELGWSAINLGPDTPASTIVEAIAALRPRVLGLGINSVGDLHPFVASYHVLTATVNAAEIPFGKPITTAGGGVFEITAGSPPTITDERDRVSRITATDIEASNGVVHVIDKVLLPAP